MNSVTFQRHLEDDLIPFWNKMADYTHGGFFGSANAKGIPNPSSDKGCILNSRILWFYSAAYKLLKKKRAS